VSIEPLMKSAALFVTAWRKGAQPKAAPIPAFRTVPEKVPTKTLPSAPPNVFKR
jgi:hypothetical protein